MDFCIHSIFNTVCSAMHTSKLSKLVVLKVVQLRARGTILHMAICTRHGELMQESLGLRPIPSEDLLFYFIFFFFLENAMILRRKFRRPIPSEDLFFGERYDFGMKIQK